MAKNKCRDNDCPLTLTTALTALGILLTALIALGWYLSGLSTSITETKTTQKEKAKQYIEDKTYMLKKLDRIEHIQIETREAVAEFKGLLVKRKRKIEADHVAEELVMNINGDLQYGGI